MRFDQECAFPSYNPIAPIQDGLTKREYYACAAMQALIKKLGLGADETAEYALEYADALHAAIAPAQPVNDNESGGKP